MDGYLRSCLGGGKKVESRSGSSLAAACRRKSGDFWSRSAAGLTMPWGTPVAPARAAMKTALLRSGVAAADLPDEEINGLIKDVDDIA